MKVALRILTILASMAVMIFALWPPDTDGDMEQSGGETSATSEKTPGEEGRVVRDLFGGVAIDAGEKAKSVISEVDEARTESFEELEEGD